MFLLGEDRKEDYWKLMGTTSYSYHEGFSNELQSLEYETEKIGVFLEFLWYKNFVSVL